MATLAITPRASAMRRKGDQKHAGFVGILQCGAHHYDFDLKTGRCLNSECAPLKVELVEDFGAAGGGAEEKTA